MLTFLADIESVSTIRCSTCSEWHHRPCVSISENKDQSFVCRRCKVQTKPKPNRDQRDFMEGLRTRRKIKERIQVLELALATAQSEHNAHEENILQDLTDGAHPYGNRLDSEANIRSKIKDLSLIYSNQEAHDLITRVLHRRPSRPLDIETCLLHPYFWDPEKRLGFLRDASDRFEIMCKDPMDSVLIRLERDAKSIIKTNWFQTLDQSADQILIKNLRQSRGYDDSSLRDLLRVLRNKVSLSFIYIYVEFFFFYINRKTTTKTSPTMSKFS
jgi:Ribonuclease 2-5A